MPTRNTSPCLLRWILQWAFLLIAPVAATNQLPATEGVQGHDNLATIMQHSPLEQAEVFTQALKIIDSIESSPSCNRLATATLLNSCQSLRLSPEERDADRKGSDSLLDDFKSIYAARLAVCELTGAKAAVPRQCAPFVPARILVNRSSTKGLWARVNSSSKKLEYPLGYEDVSEHQLAQCLKALESRPQWWTSYSNSRQNAVVMCEASRTEIDKGKYLKQDCEDHKADILIVLDELISLHRAMAGVAKDVASGLFQSVQDATESLAQQEAFARGIKRFQASILEDLDLVRTESKSIFSQILSSLQSATASASESMVKSARKVEARFEALSYGMNRVIEVIHDTRDQVQTMQQDAVGRAHDLAHLQEETWNNTRAMSTEVQNSLETVTTSQVHMLVHALQALRDDLQASHGLVVLMYERQTYLDTRMDQLTSTFASLESKAASLQVSQQSQADAQVRMHESFRTGMNAAHEIIAQVVLAAGDLQSTVDETASKVRSITMMSGFGGIMGRLACVCLVILAASTTSNKPIFCAALGTIAVGAVASLDGLSWPFSFLRLVFPSTRFVSANLAIFAPFIAIFGLCVISVILVHRLARRSLIIRSGQSLLPKIEKPELPI